MSVLRSLSVRWQLALTSAGLTFAILLLFATVVGFLTAQGMWRNFDGELRRAAARSAIRNLLGRRDGISIIYPNPRLCARTVRTVGHPRRRAAILPAETGDRARG